MALIKCPECNHDVSNQAKTCPNCGYSIEEMTEKANAKEYYQQATGLEVGKKLYLIMKVNNIPCTEFPYSMQVSPADSIEKHKMNQEWITTNLTSVEKVTLEHTKLIADNAEKDYKYFQEIIKRKKKYLERKLHSSSKIEVETKENYSKGKSQSDYTTEISRINKMASEILTGGNFSKCKCPTCGSSNVVNISTGKRLISTTLLGLASSTMGKTKECKSCGYKW